MSQIDGLNNIIEVLRRRIADSSKKVDRSGKSGKPSETGRAETSAKPTTQELHTTIQERIQVLDPDDERSPSVAARIFLESVLQWEFGEELVRDQRFVDMINEISETIQNDTKINQDMHRLLQQLASKP